MKKTKQKLICKIDKNLQIFADERQFILRRKNNRNKDTFYCDLESVIQEMSNIKLKKFVSDGSQKDLKNLGKAIRKTREYIRKTLKPILDGYKEEESKL